MATFDYARPLATANRLIARFGQAGQLRRGSTSPVNHPVMFVATDYRNEEVDGTRIMRSDKKVLMAPGSLPIEPLTSDRLVEADGNILKIISIDPLKPAGTVLLYTIQARR